MKALTITILCVDSNLPKKKKKKKLLLIFTHGIGIRWLLVHQRSCLGSPYLHGFWNEWILLNVLTSCFKYSGSLSLSLSGRSTSSTHDGVVLSSLKVKKKKQWLLKEVACSSTQSWLSFFLSFCFGCNHLVGNHLQIYPLVFWNGSRPFGLIRT